MAKSLMLIEKGSHRISWYNADTTELQNQLSLPTYPHEFIIDDDYKYAYITHYGVKNSATEGCNGKSVIVVDIQKSKIVHIYDLGEHARPHGIVFDANGRLYVLSEWTNSLLIKENPRGFEQNNLDQKWDIIIATGGERSHLCAVHRDGSRAYSMNLASHDITVFDPNDHNVMPISVKTGLKPEGIFLRADEKILYATNRNSNNVAVIDTQTLEILRYFPTPNDPCRIHYDSKRNRLMTINNAGQSFSIFDETSGKELHRHDFLTNPAAICLDEQQDFAYIAIEQQQVQKINLDNFEHVQTFRTGIEPDVMYILPDGFSAYWKDGKNV